MTESEKKIGVVVSCYKCSLLKELFERTPKSNRDYWVMTELFVELHDGHDYCDKNQFQKEIVLDIKKHYYFGKWPDALKE